jgi:hypothetical protein
MRRDIMQDCCLIFAYFFRLSLFLNEYPAACCVSAPPPFHWLGKYIYHDLIQSLVDFFASIFPRNDRKYFLLLILFIFTLNSWLTSEIASYEARNLVEGGAGSYELKLTLNDSGSDFSNKTLILFTVQEGSYYFVEKQVPAPVLSPIYAVPVNKVQKANITRIIDTTNAKVLVLNRSDQASPTTKIDANYNTPGLITNQSNLTTSHAANSALHHL